MKEKCVCEIEVRFVDMDAFGHVNNAVYLSYIEMGRVYYWRQVLGKTNYLKSDFILAHASIDYRTPAYAGEHLLVTTWVSRLGNKSYDFQYEIREKSSNRLVAEAKTVQVMYDYNTHQTKPIPDEIRKKIETFEGNFV